MLIVTFTNAAASEMRERILNALYKKIEENPNDQHIQKQITLLNKANICTIHSFCLEIIRNYFYELDISANFQIGNEAEMELLKQETIEELFEEKYIENDEKFLQLLDIYASYRGDENLKDLVLKIYNQIQSNPFPNEWLKEKVEMFNISDINNDFSQTIWGQILIKEILEGIEENKLKLKTIYKKLKRYEELEKFSNTILSDIEELEQIEKVINKDASWNELYEMINNIHFEKWPTDKKITIEYKEEAKNARDKVKKEINSIFDKIMIYSSKEANESILDMYKILYNLEILILEFEEKFQNKKKEKNKIDFHDIEHFALKILINNDTEKGVMPSKIAKELQEKFEEIAIDEYQDSNLVQEYILNSVSKQNNIFMVGDIKQSIYSFRQARPKLFLDKYKKYDLVKENIINNEIETSANGKKIKLFKNFRSRQEVLDFTNWVFESIMSEKLGDVDYNKEEYLNLGALYDENLSMQPELHILNLKKNEDDEEFEQEEKILEKTEEEAKFVAQRIEELFKENYQVIDKKQGKRNIEYRDIVILLRSTANVANIYEKQLVNRNIPVFSDTSAEYLESTEIQTILDLLRIIDNPMQDIPLVHVLRSKIGNFTDNDLIQIRLNDNKSYFYEAMLKARISANQEFKNKIEYFLDSVEEWRRLEKEIPLNELIWKIYTDTNYYYYVGLLNNGALKQANLKMLFERAKQYESASFKGLYNFIHFIDRLKITSKDLSSAKIVGENDNVVRIMSIHKSKGLEFPVVFLSNTGKQFNKQDLTDSILIHQDLGLGAKYIDYETKVEYSTLAKEAIKLKLETELISEEMRVLYVALTRAKEKLIITGVSKDFEKSCKDKNDIITLYEDDIKKNNKINSKLIRKYSSYLDWILLLVQNNLEQNKIKVYIHNLNNIQNKEEKGIENEKKTDVNIEEKYENEKIDNEILKKIKTKLNWNYPYTISTITPTKTSVSKMKQQQQENQNSIELEEILNKKVEYNIKEPDFMQKEQKISSARKGTLIHLCLQMLNSNKEYSKNDLQDLIKDLVTREIITKNDADAISISILEKYIKSDLWQELKTAKEIHKEVPFYLEVNANRISEVYSQEDSILIQGIIDLYYINKNNELILVDYKTDYIEEGQEQKLIDKYKLQLDLYKEALEKALNKKVSKVIIYSTWLGKIEIK